MNTQHAWSTRSDAARRMMAAREDMMTIFPFWGALALRLNIIEDPTCDTAWTDGVSMGYDPTYTDALTHDERVFLWAHEVAHCALGHPWRRDGRDPRWFNVATDYAINSELERHGFTLPKGVLLDPRYDGRSAEWIFDRVVRGDEDEEGEEPDEDEDGDLEDGDLEDGDLEDGEPTDEDGDCEGEGEGGEGGGKGGDGEGEDGDEGTGGDEGGTGAGAENTPPGDPRMGGGGKPRDRMPGEVRDAPEPAQDGTGMDEADWQQATSEAAMTAAARGDCPGNVTRFVGERQESKIDWIAVLRRFVSEIAAMDYSWNRPNRRYVAGGMYLPALQAEGLGPMVIGIDTSGSVDPVQLAQMEAETRAIVSEADPVRVTVIYCDTRINGAPVTFERGEPVVLELRGGGGTRFSPVFDYVDQMMDEQPACLVYLTDLYGRFPEAAPTYPVLWVNTGRSSQQAPFGETVRVR